VIIKIFKIVIAIATYINISSNFVEVNFFLLFINHQRF